MALKYSKNGAQVFDEMALKYLMKWRSSEMALKYSMKWRSSTRKNGAQVLLNNWRSSAIKQMAL